MAKDPISRRKPLAPAAFRCLDNALMANSEASRMLVKVIKGLQGGQMGAEERMALLGLSLQEINRSDRAVIEAKLCGK